MASLKKASKPSKVATNEVPPELHNLAGFLDILIQIDLANKAKIEKTTK